MLGGIGAPVIGGALSGGVASSESFTGGIELGTCIVASGSIKSGCWFEPLAGPLGAGADVGVGAGGGVSAELSELGGCNVFIVCEGGGGVAAADLNKPPSA